jgi:predicted negative regulator of RcsB-dependent stress response
VEDLSEKEQIEQFRAWWSDYGNYVIAGVVLGAIGLFGFNYWEKSRLDAAYAASADYDRLTDLVVEGDLDAAESLSDSIIEAYPDSAYAAQARLAMSRLYMDQSRDKDAADTLNDLLGSSAGEDYKKVAQLRLAKIRLYQDKADEALELLGPAGEGDGAFAARFDEARGDAYVALGQLDDAREAYRRALAETGGASTVNQEFVQLKLLDLPVEEVPAADEPADDLPPATDSVPADAAEPLDRPSVIDPPAAADEAADEANGEAAETADETTQ